MKMYCKSLYQRKKTEQVILTSKSFIYCNKMEYYKLYTSVTLYKQIKIYIEGKRENKYINIKTYIFKVEELSLLTVFIGGSV